MNTQIVRLPHDHLPTFRVRDAGGHVYTLEELVKMLEAEIAQDAIDWGSVLGQLLMADIKHALNVRDDGHLHAAFARLLEFERLAHGHVWTPGSKRHAAGGAT